jgi:hypothetical protein
MGIFFVAFNCLALLQPYANEIGFNMRGDLVFETCHVQRSTQAFSEVHVTAVFNGEQVHVTHYMDENCNFTSAANTKPFTTRNEQKLFTRLPTYFFKYSEWNNICKKLW